MSSKELKPIVGQEAITPHGLGRVCKVEYCGPGVAEVWVRDYITGVETFFDPKNIQLVPLFPESRHPAPDSVPRELAGNMAERLEVALEAGRFHKFGTGNTKQVLADYRKWEEGK